jgi:hypothetical protein
VVATTGVAPSSVQRMDRDLAEQRTREEEPRRAADPYEQRRDRLGRLAPEMESDEVQAVEEAIALAKDEEAQCHERLNRGYLDEVDQYLDDVGGTTT